MVSDGFRFFGIDVGDFFSNQLLSFCLSPGSNVPPYDQAIDHTQYFSYADSSSSSNDEFLFIRMVNRSMKFFTRKQSGHFIVGDNVSFKKLKNVLSFKYFSYNARNFANSLGFFFSSFLNLSHVSIYGSQFRSDSET